MATVNCVTELMRENDFNVMLTVFNNSSNKHSKKEESYKAWLQTVRRSLDDCVFGHSFCVLHLSTESAAAVPIAITSTQEVLTVIQQCFDEPETFRADIVNPNETTHSWIFVLSSDLK